MSITRLVVQFAGAGFLALVAVVLAYSQEGNTAQACGEAGPFEFDTYELPQRSEYARAIELATAGKAVTFAYSLAAGDYIDLRYQGLERGPRGARVETLDTSLAIPPTIYKSIAWIEANWANASNSVPWGGVGPVLRSFDCGYGIGQITSGMSNDTGTASGRQAIIGTHFVFNIAEGVRILAQKWNDAPSLRPVAGNGDPAMLEDWYFAIWAYNGFAWKNHPLNPSLDPLRGGGTAPIYHCWDPSAPSYQVDSQGNIKWGYGDYTYQERVYGCMRYPPIADGARLWNAQTFRMPDFTIGEIARAFTVENWTACAGGSFNCAGMDFPTTIDRFGFKPHPDTTPPRDPAEAALLLGNPVFSFSGPTSLTLTGYTDGTSTKGTVTVRNTGTFVGPYRIRTSAPWIVVRHPTDPASRNMDGGVVVGQDVSVVLPGGGRQQGYNSVLEISLAPRLMPAGISTGTVWIEPLLGSGSNFKIDIVAANGATNLPNKRILPELSSDGPVD